FLLRHQGLNLLNVKYMLRERNLAENPINNITIGEINFRKDLLDLDLSPGKSAEAVLGGVMASDLAIVSLMGHAVHIPDNTPAARIRLHTKDGQIIEREIWAGRDTAEWAYDRQDVKVNIKHRLPRIAESWAVEGFEGHNFLAKFQFDRAL